MFRSHVAMVSKNTLFSLFDLAVKLVKINTGSSFKTNYDGLKSQMLHTKFRANRFNGSGEELLKHKKSLVHA